MKNNSEALKTLRNLCGLFMEMNYHSEPSDFVDELNDEDPFIAIHLKQVLLHKTKAKAILKKRKFEELKQKFIELKKVGLEKLQELFISSERVEMVKLFRKFEELTESDAEAINEDQEFLAFISLMKDKLKDEDNSQ